jgi:hypothetical protein
MTRQTERRGDERAHSSVALPNFARNRVQQVPALACARCGAAVLRARRGPVPRHCVSCEIGVRQARQLRAYLRSAERLAKRLGRIEVAEAARTAASLLDSAAT